MNGFVLNYIEEIKRRITIVDAISARVSLKKSGKNYKGLCPFHNEKSGSFYVFPLTESYYCFGCHESGDIFSFAMKTEGLEFGEALEQLASRAGVLLPERQAKSEEDSEAQARRVEKERIREANAAAATWFNHLLLNSKEGQAARDYLEKRGIERASVESFGLGYALDSWDALLKHLTANGRFSSAELLAAGLIGERENEGEEGYYDRFRGRLIYPIRDRQGQIIAFGGRVLEGAPKETPKYLNSPQTVLFDKSATLYGFDLARDAIRRADSAVIVEGYMDVIVAHQAGFANVVAPLGTALNEKHVTILKKSTKRIILALDADNAGQMATLRGIEVLKQGFDSQQVAVANARGLIRFEQQLDADIRVAVLPTGKDPDEVIREGGEKWRDLLAQALPVVDYSFATIANSLDLNTAKGKSEAVEQLIPAILEVRDRIEREHYIQKLARMIQTAPEVIQNEIQRAQRQESSRATRPSVDIPPLADETEAASPAPIVQIGASSELEIEDYLMAFVWRHPAEVSRINLDNEPLSEANFTKSENRMLLEQIVSGFSSNEDIEQIQETLIPELLAHVTRLNDYLNKRVFIPMIGKFPEYKKLEFDPFSLNEAIQILKKRLDELQYKRKFDAVTEDEGEDNFEIVKQLLEEAKNFDPKPSPVFRDSRDR